MKEKRYFLVCYEGSVRGISIAGNDGFATNGCYINRIETIRRLKKINANLYNQGSGRVKVVITDIKELSESDYNDYFKDKG